MLGQVTLDQLLQDHFLWKFDSKGFSVKSFSMQVFQTSFSREQNSICSAKIWRGLAPPRAEILIWLVQLGRLNTRDRLSMMHIISPIEAVCPFCLSEVESIYHLFFSCSNSWRIWCACLNQWNIASCALNILSFMYSWTGAPFYGSEKKLWMSMYYAVILTLWKLRNRVIFRNHMPNWDYEVLMLKVNIGYQYQAWCARSPHSFLSDLLDIRLWLKSQKKHSQ